MPSTKLSQYHIKDDEFAAGCFGQILLAKDSKNQEVVIKRISKSGKSNPEEVRKEIEAGKTLSHKNIAQFIEDFSDEENDYLVFERIHGNNLLQIIEGRKFVPFSQSKATSIFSQIIDAIEYSHEQGVIHRDIKLENILMDSKGKVSVLDFGLCDLVESRESLSSKFCGSLDYVAPEVVSSKQYNGYKVDVYSLGVVLYTLLFAEFPFVVKDRINAIRNGTNQPSVAFTESKMKKFGVGEDAKDLIIKMLIANPNERISIEEIIKHPYIRKVKEMEQKQEQEIIQKQEIVQKEEIVQKQEKQVSKSYISNLKKFKKSICKSFIT